MTMRVDAYTHFIPERFYKDVMSVGSHKDIGKRMMGVPAIFDINVRKKVVDKFKDYCQILSYPMPPFELMTKNPASRPRNTPRSSTTASPSSAPRTPTISPAGWRRRRWRRPTSASARPPAP